MNDLELYIFSNDNLEIVYVTKFNDYKIELDEETNAKSEFIISCNRNIEIKKGYFLVINGLYKQFNFVIDDVIKNKKSNKIKLIALDISNIFNRKVIEKKTEIMENKSLEEFIKETILDNFVNGDILDNIKYLEINCKTKTMKSQDTSADKGIYNLHTFIINCRQAKNIDIKYTITKNKLILDIEKINSNKILIDCTTSEVIDYKKTYDSDPVSKVTVYCPTDKSEYNLYLLNDRTTTTDENNLNRAKGKTEVIAEENKEKVEEKALEIIMKNRYKHLVEFKIKKNSKLIDTTELEIGTKIKIKTDESIYDSYISAIILTDNNFITYKSGNIRINLLEKLKQGSEK